MTKDEALKLALEALEHMLEDAKQERLTVEYWNECVDAITAIKQARSAPVQPCNPAEDGVCESVECDCTTPPAAPVQENTMIYRTFEQWKGGNVLEHGVPRTEHYSEDQLDLVEMGWSYGYDAGRAVERALDKKAENARELGLDYEPVLKDNSNYRYDPPVAEPVAYLCENAVGHKYFRWKKPSSEFKPIALYTTPPAAQPAPVQPVAFEVGLVEWVGNKLMATPKVTTNPPASWMEMVTANLVREGVNKHKARELAEHFYGLAPAAQLGVPDAFGTREGEHPQYIEGWNDCRAEMLRGNP